MGASTAREGSAAEGAQLALPVPCASSLSSSAAEGFCVDRSPTAVSLGADIEALLWTVNVEAGAQHTAATIHAKSPRDIVQVFFL
jgi:hypothetical protein